MTTRGSGSILQDLTFPLVYLNVCVCVCVYPINGAIEAWRDAVGLVKSR